VHPQRPHLLGIDDGPFEKQQRERVPVVGVTMEGADLVEAVAMTELAVDAEDATEHLAGWIADLRIRPALHGVMLGGITIAGLAVVDAVELARRLQVPVLVVNRRDPSQHRLDAALESAGFPERLAIVRRTPPAVPVGDRLFVAAAGIDPGDAVALVRASQNKSEIPEPLRLAHLIARARVSGESRGRA